MNSNPRHRLPSLDLACGRSPFGLTCTFVIVFLTPVIGSSLEAAQAGGGTPRVNQEDNQQRRGGPTQGPRAGPDRHSHPPAFFKRLRELPPEEQERVMANDERFQRLPPARQTIIRRNLERWNSLTPRQKEQIRERQEILESLSPAQRREARALFPRYNHLPPDRKKAVREAFLHARDLSPSQREQFLSSSEVTDNFSPPERRLLRGLTRLLPDSKGGRNDNSEDEP
jgi:hypothetical protein